MILALAACAACGGGGTPGEYSLPVPRPGTYQLVDITRGGSHFREVVARTGTRVTVISEGGPADAVSIYDARADGLHLVAIDTAGPGAQHCRPGAKGSLYLPSRVRLRQTWVASMDCHGIIPGALDTQDFTVYVSGGAAGTETVLVGGRPTLAVDVAYTLQLIDARGRQDQLSSISDTVDTATGLPVRTESHSQGAAGSLSDTYQFVTFATPTPSR